jgi:hypothetical protein
MANASPELREQFQQTGQLPPPIAQEILAHGISTALRVGAGFALISLLVSIFMISARAEDLDTSAVPGMQSS